MVGNITLGEIWETWIFLLLVVVVVGHLAQGVHRTVVANDTALVHAQHSTTVASVHRPAADLNVIVTELGKDTELLIDVGIVFPLARGLIQQFSLATVDVDILATTSSDGFRHVA